MKYDLELVRKILQAAEDHPHGSLDDNPTIEGYTSEQIGYHVYIMAQDNLVKAFDDSSMDSPSPRWQILNLTSKGHEFLAYSESQATWNKAKEKIAEAGISVTLTTVFEVLKNFATASIKSL